MFVCLFKLGLFGVLTSNIFNCEKHVENKLLLLGLLDQSNPNVHWCKAIQYRSSL